MALSALGPVQHTEPRLEQAGCVPASAPPDRSAAVLSRDSQVFWRCHHFPLPSKSSRLPCPW